MLRSRQVMNGRLLEVVRRLIQNGELRCQRPCRTAVFTQRGGGGGTELLSSRCTKRLVKDVVVVVVRERVAQRRRSAGKLVLFDEADHPMRALDALEAFLDVLGGNLQCSGHDGGIELEALHAAGDKHLPVVLRKSLGGTLDEAAD